MRSIVLTIILLAISASVTADVALAQRPVDEARMGYWFVHVRNPGACVARLPNHPHPDANVPAPNSKGDLGGLNVYYACDETGIRIPYLGYQGHDGLTPGYKQSIAVRLHGLDERRIEVHASNGIESGYQIWTPADDAFRASTWPKGTAGRKAGDIACGCRSSGDRSDR